MWGVWAAGGGGWTSVVTLALPSCGAELYSLVTRRPVLGESGRGQTEHKVFSGLAQPVTQTSMTIYVTLTAS